MAHEAGHDHRLPGSPSTSSTASLARCDWKEISLRNRQPGRLVTAGTALVQRPRMPNGYSRTSSRSITTANTDRPRRSRSARASNAGSRRRNSPSPRQRPRRTSGTSDFTSFPTSELSRSNAHTPRTSMVRTRFDGDSDLSRAAFPTVGGANLLESAVTVDVLCQNLPYSVAARSSIRVSGTCRP